MKALCDGLKSWNTEEHAINLIGPDKNSLERLSLINAGLNNIIIYELCDSLQVINKVGIRKLVLNENPFGIGGIASICRMLDITLEKIDKKDSIIKANIQVDAPEGEIAQILEKILRVWTDISIGSYPFYNSDDDYGVKVEISSLNQDQLKKATNDLKKQLSKESIKYK